MNSVRLGVMDQSPVRAGSFPVDAVHETVALAGIAERLGYGRYWLAEHHGSRSFASSSPAVLGAAVAAGTKRIRVGSGGVMLCHYSPLAVAENFRTLEALHPGRIDLGVGRAPGGDPDATLALQYWRSGLGLERFPEQLADLIRWAHGEEGLRPPFDRVPAMPATTSAPPIWVLGSGGSTAECAAQHGCGYSFGLFLRGQDGTDAIKTYVKRFRPSRYFETPQATVAVNVLCAPTAREARTLALSSFVWRKRQQRGHSDGVPSPEEAKAELAHYELPVSAVEEDSSAIVGEPEYCRSRLLQLAKDYGVEEVLVVTITHDPSARIRSYELLARVMGLAPARMASR